MIISEDNEKDGFIKSHKNCMVCSQNDYSLKIKFVDDENGKTFSKFRGNNNFQGYADILHGGIITTLLDATMTHCLFNKGIEAFTGDLQVRFLHQIPCNSTIKLHAQIIKVKKPLYVLRAEAICEKKIMAWAEAKFIQIEKMDK